jgi:hypothetical protein
MINPARMRWEGHVTRMGAEMNDGDKARRKEITRKIKT